MPSLCPLLSGLLYLLLVLKATVSQYSLILFSFHFSPVQFLIKSPITRGSTFPPWDLVLYYLAALKPILLWELPNPAAFVQPQQLEYTSNAVQCWTTLECVKWSECVSTGFPLPSQEHVCYKHQYLLSGTFWNKYMNLKQNSFSFVTIHKQYCHCTVTVPYRREIDVKITLDIFESLFEWIYFKVNIALK